MLGVGRALGFKALWTQHFSSLASLISRLFQGLSLNHHLERLSWNKYDRLWISYINITSKNICAQFTLCRAWYWYFFPYPSGLLQWSGTVIRLSECPWSNHYFPRLGATHWGLVVHIYFSDKVIIGSGLLGPRALTKSMLIYSQLNPIKNLKKINKMNK